MKKIDKQLIFNKYSRKCGYCGHDIGDIKDMQVDHIIPKRNYDICILEGLVPTFLSHLGLLDCNHIDNLMPSCKSCNNYKATFDLETFRNEVEKQVERCEAYSTNFRIAKRYGLVKVQNKEVVFYFENQNKRKLIEEQFIYLYIYNLIK